MWRKLVVLVFETLLLGFGVGCVTVQPIHDLVRPLTLGRYQVGEASTEVYRLHGWSTDGELLLEVETRTETERPYLGLRWREIENEVGEGLIRRCLIVAAVDWESPAERVGILADDVIISVDGVEVYSNREMEDLLWTKVVPGDPVTLMVRRADRREERTLEIVIPSEREPTTEVSRKTIRLKGVSGKCRALTGIILGEVPSPWSQRIFEEAGPVLVIGDVSVGSPAYYSGLRAGDRIVTVGGKAVGSMEALARDLVTQGEDEDTVVFEVSRGTGDFFETEVELGEFSRTTEFYIPFVVRVRSDQELTRWSLGPFGWLMAYEGRALVNRERRTPSVHRRFGMLLNGVKTETWSGGYNVRLLWVIGFGAR